MQDDTHFDYVIIGSGLAGLQLALALSEDPFFDSFKIALIDPSDKSTNDKTWSFWEQGKGKWDAIVESTWDNAFFKSSSLSLSLPLDGYSYKTIKSLKFYNYAKQRLDSHRNIHFILDAVQTIDTSVKSKIITKNSTYTANHVFDSRIPEDYYTEHRKHVIIHQHFKGWVIETDIDTFQPDSFTMMDYRFQHKDSTSFIYVLPFSTTKALVEYTFFTPYTVEDPIYDRAIRTYLKEIHQLENFKILETEIGNIPMTDFPFWNYHTKNITKIGTGGGWIKGSTGYSFKHTEKLVAKVIQNIKSKRQPSKDLFQSKYKFYDKIFLNVLQNENEKGVWVFERFYSKNPIRRMFRFLDEETSFGEDLAIMKSLFSIVFIKWFFRVLFRF